MHIPHGPPLAIPATEDITAPCVPARDGDQESGWPMVVERQVKIHRLVEIHLEKDTETLVLGQSAS
jgi:hypothetical protein